MSITDIDRRLAKLDAELAQPNGARAALVNGALGANVSKPRRPSCTPAKRTYEVVPAGKLVALLSGSQGMKTRELSQATNGDPVKCFCC